jgi:hypothetical protein
VWTTAYILPGDSGSPILDDAAKIVGIIHRGPTAQDLYASRGVDTYSIGTASSSLSAAMKAPLPSAMISTAAVATRDRVLADDLLYFNAHVSQVSVAVAAAPGTAQTTSVLAILADACDAALARTDIRSPEDLSSALQPCTDGLAWIECRSDAATSHAATVCPAQGDAALWLDRFAKVNAAWRALNGEVDLVPLAFGAAATSSSLATGVSAGAARLTQALADAGAPLDPGIANVLAAFGVASYAGQDVAAYIKGYKKIPSYALSGASIVSASLWLVERGSISRDDALSILDQLYGDPAISVGAKLYDEEERYYAGVLP